MSVGLEYRFDGEIFVDAHGAQLHEDQVPDVAGHIVIVVVTVASEHVQAMRKAWLDVEAWLRERGAFMVACIELVT